MAQRPGVRRLSVCRFFSQSQTTGRIATKLAHDGLRVSGKRTCIQVVLKVKVNVT